MITCDLGGAMKLKPLADRILIKRIEEDNKTPGGIIIPDNAKEKPMHAKVIAVGPGKLSQDGTIQPLQIKEGDTVLFSKYSGTDISLEGDEYLILKEDDVLGIIES